MSTTIVLGEETLRETKHYATRIRDSAERVQELLDKKIINYETANEITQNIGSIHAFNEKLAGWTKHWNKRVQEVV